ncbi:MAG TPA: LysR family transcriptional regulator [Streptosporangiaceae bacterium]|nr:LysR family transcriptional regulator [Streptosporangiaceae bacterium]
MTLNQLRTFLAVAETGSVRAAAQDLVVTQAAVSASLAALQKSLGVGLLEPDGRGLRLTAAGQAYAGYARRGLGLLDAAGRAAEAAADPERGELRIGAVTTAAEQILPGLLSGFRTRYPRLGIRLEAGNRDRVRGLLDRHQVDLVLGGRPEPGWDVEVLAVRAHQLVVVAAPGLAARAEPGPRPEPAAEAADPGAEPASPDASHLVPWLAGQAWLLREPGSGTRAATDALLTELDITPLTLMVGSNGAIRESASVGLGVTLISRDAVAAELADGRLVPLPVPATPMHRDWYLVARADPPGAPPPAAARLVAHVLAHGGFQPPAPPRGR